MSTYVSLREVQFLFLLHSQTDLAGPRKNVACPFVIKPILTKLKINKVLLALLSTKMLTKFSQAGYQISQVGN
jgi:hypothetical protein